MTRLGLFLSPSRSSSSELSLQAFTVSTRRPESAVALSRFVANRIRCDNVNYKRSPKLMITEWSARSIICSCLRMHLGLRVGVDWGQIKEVVWCMCSWPRVKLGWGWGRLGIMSEGKGVKVYYFCNWSRVHLELWWWAQCVKEIGCSGSVIWTSRCNNINNNGYIWA